MPRICLIGAFWALILGLAGPARADEGLRVVVRVGTAIDRVLLTRVLAQTSDLEVDVIGVSDRPLEKDLEAQWGAARAYADAHRARVVVWFHLATSQELFVAIALPADQRLFVRTLVAPEDDRSSAYEEAALIVRAAVRALRAGGTVGATYKEVPPGEEPRAEVAPPPRPLEVTPAPPPTSPRRPAPASPPPAVRVASSVGAGVTFNALTSPMLTTRIGVESRRWTTGLALRLGLPSDYADAFGQVRVRQDTLAAEVGLLFQIAEHLHGCACVDAGVTGFRHSTLAATRGAEAAAPRWLWSAVAGPELRVAYRARILGGLGLGLGVTGGADAVFAPPRLDHLGPRGILGTRQFWAVEPRVGVLVEIGSFD